MLEDGKVRSVLARAVEEATKISAHLGSAPAKMSETAAGQRGPLGIARCPNPLARIPPQELIELEDRWGAHNYRPLDVVIEHAAGVWVYDVEGKRYLDCLSAYSALNQGHCHPRIIQALQEQAARVTLTSRAFRNDQLPRFVEELARICGMEMVLPMNTGAEAVESAIKAVRRWGYTRKGIPHGHAEIIVCENNFHGRTTTIVGFLLRAAVPRRFGPFTPGFVACRSATSRRWRRRSRPTRARFCSSRSSARRAS